MAAGDGTPATATRVPGPGPSTALLIIDMQRDFVDEGGSLRVPGASRLSSLINRLAAAVAAAGGAVAASLDWHPLDHVSFVSSHPGQHQPGDRVEVEVGGQRMTVTLFPPHCVAGSPGAELSHSIEAGPIHHMVRKGRQAGLESFSAFHDMARVSSTDLADWLRACGAHILLVCGVATEYCVRATVLDALSEGFDSVALLTDAVAGVDEEASREAMGQMQQAGAVLLVGEELLGSWGQPCATSAAAATPREAAAGGKAGAAGGGDALPASRVPSEE